MPFSIRRDQYIYCLDRGRWHQTQPDSSHGGLGARSRPNLGKNIAQVNFHRVGADKQLGSNLFIASPGRHEPQYILFPVTEVVDFQLAHKWGYYNKKEAVLADRLQLKPEPLINQG